LGSKAAKVMGNLALLPEGTTCSHRKYRPTQDAEHRWAGSPI
jgi:hypothetical protein